MNIKSKPTTTWFVFTLMIFVSFFVAACNLTRAPEEQLEITSVPTGAALAPTRTLGSNEIPTPLSVTPLSFPTQSVRLPPTSVITNPQFFFPTRTPLPVSIVILSPIPGNVVAGNVQVLGAATHPQFLQFQLEYGPDPNPNNLWFPVTGVVQVPLTSYGLLGIWNTTSIPDSIYQLRLRVFLRDGTELRTVVNNIRVQNQAPTPVPTSTPAIARPIAAFTQDRATGDAPLVVRFTNQSVGDITSYSWSFGDGSSSNELSPAHTFNTPGVYVVGLTVVGPGGSSNVSRQITVQSATAPVAAFTQDRISGPSPLNVQFTNQSVGNITSVEWNFGDGTTSAVQSPAHQFTNVGTYNVILRVAGPGGSSSVTRQITVENPQVPPPDASFNPNTTIRENIPFAVQFQDTSTGNITGYTWNFGDGSAATTEQNPAHTFTTAGTFTVTLTVVGPGGQDTAQVTVEAIQPPDVPTAAFTVDGAASGPVPFTAAFTNTSQGQIDTVLWEFGDGSTSDSADSSLTHQYTNAGTYTVRLTVSNQSGSSSAEQTVTALSPVVPPDASFIANPTSGPAPLTVEFTDQSSGDNLTYQWNFGDGSPTSSDSGPILSHQFTMAGTYTVTLTVSNANTGQSDSHQVQITVDQPPPLTADFNITENAPLQYTFEATVTNGVQPYTFTWNFGDSQTATGQTVSHTYGTANTYTITLRVTDSNSNTVDVAKQINVSGPPLPEITASFNATETSPLNFAFAGSASGGDGNLSYTWDFGDGQTATGQNVSHTYAAAGSYTVTMSVADASGTSPAVVSQNIAATPAPVAINADFSATETSPLNFEFSASASGGDGNFTFSWDFGDGQTATGQTVTHVYGTASGYTVVLTVSDASGNTPATITRDVTATPAPVAISADFIAAESSPLNVNFSASASGGDGNFTFSWNFGDGQVGAGQNLSHTYAAAGTYTVTLTVSDNSGNTPAVVSKAVTASPVPVPISADFIAAETSPLNVDFSASASGGDGNFTFSWNFGDGQVGAGQIVSHAYPAAGTYTVTLTVSDNSGNTPATVTRDVITTPAFVPISADFIAAESSPLNVDFSASASGGDGNFTFSWNFGDGQVGAGQIASHAYPAAGTYTVTLTVSDNSGNTPATVTRDVITTPAPVAISADFTASETTPLNVDFAASASGGDGNFTFSWNFGDGQVGAGQFTTHTYAAAGTYTVILTVSDNSGNTPATVVRDVTVTPATAPISADFIAAETSPLNVDFSASASGGDGNFTFSWNFGDGQVGGGQVVSHGYGAAGAYTVTLTVSDASGNTPATVTRTVTATAPAGPSIVETTTVQPNLNELYTDLHPVYVNGVNQGNRPNVFAVAGDDMVTSANYLEPFGTPGAYTIDPSVAGLQNIVDYYSMDLGDGTNSFTRQSVAANAGFRAADLLRPGTDFSGQCAGGETLIGCEIRLTAPSVILINIGYNDALNGTDPATFAAQLDQIAREALNRNVIPVLATIYPRLGDQTIVDRTRALNEAIITVADTLNVPVFNQWRGLNELPNSGLSGDNVTPSIAPEGPGYVSSGVNAGANARNLYTLLLLESINGNIFP